MLIVKLTLYHLCFSTSFIGFIEILLFILVGGNCHIIMLVQRFMIILLEDKL